MANIAYLMVVFLVVAHMMVEQGESVKCSGTDTRTMEALCGPYVTGKQPDPTGECCSAVKEVRGMPNTKETRRQLCHCVQKIAKNMAGSLITRFDELPLKCGIPVLYSADPTFDCNTRSVCLPENNLDSGNYVCSVN